MLRPEPTDIDYIDRIDESVLTDQSSSGPVDEVLGSAARNREAGPEEQFRGRRNHDVTTWFPPGEAAGNETKYELECNICGVIGATKGKELADVLARLHENFVSVLVDLREAGERA
jgi:hypothetical protein